MTRPPDSEEIQAFRERAAIGFEETLGLRATDDSAYTGDWLPIATLFLLHPEAYACLNEEIYSTNERTRYTFRESLPPIEYRDLTHVQLQNKQSVKATEKYDSVRDHATQMGPEQRPRVVIYGMDETFWQTLGAFELAKQGYIVFPEALSLRWGGRGLPDLTCFQLGRLQEVLADLGIVPGGATIQEIELRTAYETCSPTSITATEMVGVAEAKDTDNIKKGRRELEDYRNSKRNPAYLDGAEIEKGWLLAPNATDEIRADNNEIGGVTWENGQILYAEPPTVAVDKDKRSAAVQIAKRMILDIVLRHQELPDSLESTIKSCLEDPDELYAIFEHQERDR